MVLYNTYMHQICRSEVGGKVLRRGLGLDSLLLLIGIGCLYVYKIQTSEAINII